MLERLLVLRTLGFYGFGLGSAQLLLEVPDLKLVVITTLRLSDGIDHDGLWLHWLGQCIATLGRRFVFLSFFFNGMELDGPCVALSGAVVLDAALLLQNWARIHQIKLIG